MQEDDIKSLEAKVEQLIRAVAALQDENSSLRTQQRTLMSERAELLQKTELARERVETMITRLKALEQE
ncbi:MAG: TIGR02449 family protein [Gammaproteobacteria bacterium]|nr:TIGR02449 family protein [Gammaproteobacteria bacterium]